MIAYSTFGIYWNQSFVSLNKTVPKLMIYRILNSNLLWRGLHRYITVKHGCREHA